MKYKFLLGVAFVAAIVAAAGYAPDRTAALAPSLGPLAHRVHDAFAGGPPDARAAKTEAGPPAIHVTVVAVQRADAPLTLAGVGQIQAYNTVTMRTRVDGAIEKIGFREGQDVKAGDVVAQIDPRPFQAALDQATAKRGQDQANLANARLDLSRDERLTKLGAATQQQLDTQQALVDQLAAAIAADDAAIDSTKVQLDYTTIRAPISGRAGLRLVDAGNMVSASQQTAIVTLAQVEPVAAIFNAPQGELRAIQKAMAEGAPKVEVQNTAGETLAVGKLIVVDNQVDPTTATVKLKAEFPNSDHALWPGEAVSTVTTIGVDRGALTIPAAAVQRGAQGLYVYTVDGGGHARLRYIRVARQTPEVAIVAQGLAAGDSVITDNLFLLQDGAPVRVDPAATGS